MRRSARGQLMAPGPGWITVLFARGSLVVSLVRDAAIGACTPIHDVVPGVADQCVVPGVAVETILTLSTDQGVVPVTPGQDVIPAGSGHEIVPGLAKAAVLSAAANDCYVPSSETIVSLEPLKPHEIVHVFEPLVGSPDPAPAVFSEGIATMLGGTVGPPRPDGRLDMSLDLENLLESRAFYARTDEVGPSVTYSAAAGLMRFLLDRHGRDTFLLLFGALDGAADGAEIERRFQAVVGEGLRDVIAAWRAAVPPPYDEIVLHSPVCDQVPAVASPGETVLEPDCAFDARRFEVPRSGRLDLVFHRVAGQPIEKLGLVHLYRCEGGLPLEVGTFVRGDLRLALDVAPGGYMALVSGASVSVSVPRQPVTLDADALCTTNRIPAALGGPDATSLVVIRRWTNGEAHLALDLDIASPGRLGIGGVSAGFGMPNDVYACAQACTPDPTQQCAHDSLPGVQSLGEPRDVFGMPVAGGDRLHFETGPRSRPDWQYSLQFSIDAVGP